MQTAKNVTVIPATVCAQTRLPVQQKARRRVAAYARVSTDSEEHLTSYEAQVDYYTDFIRSHPEWEFVSVYTDEGVSGLGTRKTGWLQSDDQGRPCRQDRSDCDQERQPLCA